MLFTGRSFTRVLLLNFLVLNMHFSTTAQQLLASSASQQWTETGVEDQNQDFGRERQLSDSLLPAMRTRTAAKQYLDESLDQSLDQYSQEFLKAFESRLFRLFGLKSRPKPKKHYKIPDYMIQLYQKQQQLNHQTSDNYFYDTDRQNGEELTADETTDYHNKRSATKPVHRSHYNKRLSLSGNPNTIISHKQHYEGMRPQTYTPEPLFCLYLSSL